MVGLHMVYNKIVDRFISQYRYYLTKELIGVADIYGIDQSSFIIVNNIRVVRHAVRQWPQVFKKMLGTVVYTYIKKYLPLFRAVCT